MDDWNQLNREEKRNLAYARLNKTDGNKYKNHHYLYTNAKLSNQDTRKQANENQKMSYFLLIQLFVTCFLFFMLLLFRYYHLPIDEKITEILLKWHDSVDFIKLFQYTT